FVVPTDTPGFTANVIHRKLSLRASITSELVLEGVRLPADAVLPGSRGLGSPLSCLNEARYGIVWGVAGAARACYEAALEYAGTREQFGRPIAGFQLTQRKLADMVVDVNHAGMTALQIGRLKDQGLAHHNHVSFGKFANVAAAQRVAAAARSVHGANGITLEYPVMRHMVNLETVATYEGTEEIHALSIGQAVTGISAFR
ncbi:acyl-CoA dehydrogenase family protein, partial [Nocardiopsis protaetiae]